jgi:hypothetical protein
VLAHCAHKAGCLEPPLEGRGGPGVTGIEIAEVVDHAERTQHHFTGRKTGDRGTADSPVPAQRPDDRLHEAARLAQEAAALGGASAGGVEPFSSVE